MDTHGDVFMLKREESRNKSVSRDSKVIFFQKKFLKRGGLLLISFFIPCIMRLLSVQG